MCEDIKYETSHNSDIGIANIGRYVFLTNVILSS